MLDIDNLIEDCKKVLDSSIYEDMNEAFIATQLIIDLDSPLLPLGKADHIYWARPDDNYRAVGLGWIFYQEESGSQRFSLLQKAYQNYCSSWGQPPFAFMAYSFDSDDLMSDEWEDFANAFVCVPRLLIEQTSEKQTITFNFELKIDLEPQFDWIRQLLEQWLENDVEASRVTVDTDLERKEDSSKSAWLQKSAEALDLIRQHQFRKLVMSYRKEIRIIPSFNPDTLLSRLIERYPSCTIISYVDGDKQFVAATPERLLSLKSGNLQSDAIGGTLSEDEAKQCSYLINKNSKYNAKLLDEHAIIVEDICHNLSSICDTLSLSTAPQLKKLHNIYHLETTISGRLRSEQSVISLIAQLHPTPAIAGYPSSESVDWLRNNEKHSRGWYAGAFGFMHGEQNGEVSVLLRCALIKQEKMYIYAGAGLVSESDIEKEWQEIELKMNTILDLL